MRRRGSSYHGARYYAPWLGRWTSCDPVGGRSAYENLYEYVRGNPVIVHDPNGKDGVVSEVIKGDFHEGETTWTGTLVNVGVGLIPIVGQIADARDTAAAAKNLWQKPSLGTAGMFGLALLGWIPLAGDLVKGGSKVGKKVIKEAAEEALEKGAKEATEKAAKEAADKAAKEAAEKAAKEAADKAAKEAADKAAKEAADKAAKESAEKAATNPTKRVPKTEGSWEGTPGNGKWLSEKDVVNKITGGKPIEFINGRPNFSPWSKGSLTFKAGQLTGGAEDFRLVYEKLKQQLNLKSLNEAKEWLRKKGLTPHHKSDTIIELIPTDLHKNIPHVGSASDLRRKVLQ